MKNKKFWNWQTDADTGGRTLIIDGVIAEESWWGDEVTPKQFADELKGKGDITLWINSPGGDCIAASRIYTMLKGYDGKVTVKIDGIAASAASVIAMAGDEVLMSPTALMMIHNPWAIAMGDSAEMQKASEMLNEIKESIVNAYMLKTGLSRNKLAKLMDDETWMNANKAIELGFADAVLFDSKKPQTENSYSYSQKAVLNCLLNKLPLDEHIKKIEAAPIMERLNKLKH